MNSIQYMQYLITKSFKNIFQTLSITSKYELIYYADHLMSEPDLYTNFVNDINYRKSIKNKSIIIMEDYLNSLFKNIFNVENIGLAS